MANGIKLEMDDALQIVRAMESFRDSHEQFMKTGISSIEEMHIEGDKKVQVDNTLDVIRENSKKTEKATEDINEALKAIIAQVADFSLADVLKKARETAEESKDTSVSKPARTGRF